MAYPRTDLKGEEQNRETQRVLHRENYSVWRRYIQERLFHPRVYLYSLGKSVVNSKIRKISLYTS